MRNGSSRGRLTGAGFAVVLCAVLVLSASGAARSTAASATGPTSGVPGSGVLGPGPSPQQALESSRAPSDSSKVMTSSPLRWNAACLVGRPDTRADARALALGCDTYIVLLKNAVSSPAAVAEDHSRAYGARVKFVYRAAVKGYAAVIPLERVASLRADPRVASVELDQKVEAFPQDTPTGISRIFVPQNRSLNVDRADDVRVDADIAIIDSGIDYGHPDLNLVGRTDCTTGDPLSKKPLECLDDAGDDANGHGTHVAGIAAALDNGDGVVGTAPGARLWSVKVLDASGQGSVSQIVAGIDWVTAHAALIDVANMSLGCECQSDALDQAITTSVAAGVVYTVAAGNSARDAGNTTPAHHPDVITVSALADFDGEPGALGSPTCSSDEDDTLANFSNYGAVIDLAAPGVCIHSTWKGGGYATISGTSMAAPHVAGAAAIIASRSKPQSKAGVTAVRDALVAAGNLNWSDVMPGTCTRRGCSPAGSPDSIQEPLIDVHDMHVFRAATVTGPFNTSPKARFARSCDAEPTCSFNASGSSDLDGTITGYAWSFGDGTTAAGVAASHAYKKSGAYVVTLTVTDDRGSRGRQATLVTVSDGSESKLANPHCDTPGDDKCEKWIAVYDNPNGLGRQGFWGIDFANGQAVSPTGDRVFVTGASWDNTTGSRDIATVAYEAATGARLWTARYNGPQGLDDIAFGVVSSSDGRRVYVTGVRDADYSRERESRWDIVTVAYDAATGAQLWVSAYGRIAPDGVDGPEALAVSPDGSSVYVTGSSCEAYSRHSDDFDPVTSCDYTTLAYDAATGAQRWVASYDGAQAYDVARAVVVSPDSSRVYVAGESTEQDKCCENDYATIAYDARSGNELWARRYNSGNVEYADDRAYFLAISGDGERIYVGGDSSDGYDDGDFATVAYDANGTEQWVARYEPGGYSTGLATPRAGRGVYLVGAVRDGGCFWCTDAVTIAYDGTGAERWTARYGNTGAVEGVEGVTTSPDGSEIYVAAYGENAKGGTDLTTIAYRAVDGGREWTARYNSSRGKETDFDLLPILTTVIGVSPNGRSVYVSGTFYAADVYSPNAANFGTVAYDVRRSK